LLKKIHFSSKKKPLLMGRFGEVGALAIWCHHAAGITCSQAELNSYQRAHDGMYMIDEIGIDTVGVDPIGNVQIKDLPG